MADKHAILKFQKWPYYVGQAILTVIAIAIAVRADDLSGGVAFFCVLSAVLGSFMLVVPFYVEHRTQLQAYIVDSQTKAAMQRDRFAQWESLFMEQLQRFAALNAQVEHNMLATEGMVRRADYKLQALEALEEKIDDILSLALDKDKGKRKGKNLQKEEEPTSVANNPFSTLQENAISIVQKPSSLEPFKVAVAPLPDLSLNRRENPLGGLEVDSIATSKDTVNVEDLASKSLTIPDESSIFRPEFNRSIDSLADHNFFQPSEELKGEESIAFFSAENELNPEESLEKNAIERKSTLRKKKKEGEENLYNISPASHSQQNEEIQTNLFSDPLLDEENKNGNNVESLNLGLATVGETSQVDKDGGEDEEKFSESTFLNQNQLSADQIFLSTEAQSKQKRKKKDTQTSNVNENRAKGPTGDRAGNRIFAEAAKRQAKPEESVVIANVMIGLGNKPFIRGTGAGLSWDKGVPMEFLEIGKWSWSTKNKDELIEFQILKNDKEFDERYYQVNSGEWIEVVPQFLMSAVNTSKL